MAWSSAKPQRRRNTDMSKSAQSSTTVELESDLIGQDPEALKQAFLAALVPGHAIVVQAAAVSRAGTATLQLLLAFLRDARAKGLAFEVRDASPALRDAASAAGLTADLGL
jgi:anti-anti-sigma regulatory factor